MTEYVVLLPGDEQPWADADAAERERVYNKHGEFAKALEERGHKVTGGAELTHSSSARTVRRTAAGFQVTDGPYAETVEQLTGFYVVESDDLDDLLEVVGILAEGEDGIEVRACVDHSGSSGGA